MWRFIFLLLSTSGSPLFCNHLFLVSCVIFIFEEAVSSSTCERPSLDMDKESSGAKEPNPFRLALDQSIQRSRKVRGGNYVQLPHLHPVFPLPLHHYRHYTRVPSAASWSMTGHVSNRFNQLSHYKRVHEEGSVDMCLEHC